MATDSNELSFAEKTDNIIAQMKTLLLIDPDVDFHCHYHEMIDIIKFAQDEASDDPAQGILIMRHIDGMLDCLKAVKSRIVADQ